MEYTNLSIMSGQPSMPNSFNDINHLKLPSPSVQKTHDFDTRIFPFTPLPRYDHFTPDHKVFAKMFQHKQTKLIIEVRYVPAHAAAEKGWDPIAYGVGTCEDLKQRALGMIGR
jgi:hypothetical protein